MRRASCLAALVVILLLMLSGVALGAGSGSRTPGSVNANGQLVHLTWKGMAANQPIWIQQCNNVTVGFDQSVDCSLLSAKERQATFNPGGSGKTGTTGPTAGLNPDFQVFVGEEPSGDLGWGCSSKGTVGGKVVNGVKYFNPCRVRVTDGSLITKTNEFFLPITFTGSGSTASGPAVGDEMPKTGVGLFVPVGAAAVLAAGFLIWLRRDRRPARR